MKPTTTPALYSVLLKDAMFVAQSASKLLERYQSRARIVVQKDIADFATDADIASENLIRGYIQKNYPNHGIYGEEGGQTGKGEFLWIVDPLDGTKEYARGLKEYNCLIAIEHNRELVVGVIKRLGINELYSTVISQGAKKDGKKIQVSGITDLNRSHIGYHLPVGSSRYERNHVTRHFRLLEQLTFDCYRLRPGWDDAKALGYVASGITDAAIIPAELPNGWHDLAAGILLVQEAGGKVTHLDGNPVVSHDMSKGFLASNGKIHDTLLAIIRKEHL